MHSSIRARRPSIGLVAACAIGLMSVIALTYGDMSTVRAQAPSSPQFEVHLYGGSVTGRGTPEAEVIVWLKDELGETIGPWSTTADAAGEFGVGLWTTDEAGKTAAERLEPGQQLRVQVAGTDPIVFDLPQLTAAADPETDVVSGVAPPDSELRVAASAVAPAYVVAGEDGTWSADFSAYGLTHDHTGSVSLLRSDGHRVHLDWAVPRVRIHLTTGAITLYGSAWRDSHVRLLDGEGTQVASFERRSLFPVDRSTWYASGRLHDVFARPVAITSVHRLVGWFGDAPIDLTVPQVSLTIDTDTNQVRGLSSAPPGTEVSGDVFGPECCSNNVRTTVGEDGRFTIDVLEGDTPRALQARDVARIGLDMPGARYVARSAVPGMTLHAVGPVVEIIAPPHTNAAVEHRRSGQVLDTVHTRADGHGEVTVAVGSADEPWALEAGDEVGLAPTGDARWAPTSLRVPALDLSITETSIAGCRPTPVGATLRVSTETDGPVGMIDRDWTSVLDPDEDCFEIDLTEVPVPGRPGGDPEHLTLVPGDSVILRMTTEDGHAIQLRRVIPQIHAELSSDRVCVQGDPNVPVTLRSGGPSPERAEATTDAFGRARLRMAGPDGASHRLQSGVEIDGDVGAHSVRTILPELLAEVDWASQLITVTGRRFGDFGIRFPGRHIDCWGEYRPPRYIQWPDRWLLPEPPPPANGHDPSPAEIIFTDASIYPGIDFRDGLMVEAESDQDHRLFVRRYPLQVTAHIGSRRIGGQANPHATVVGSVRTAHGTTLDAITMTANADGEFVGDLATRDPVIRSGDRIHVTSGNHEGTLVVPTLRVDWSSSVGLAGFAPPDTPVSITLRLDDGRTLGLPRASDADGRFAFGPSEMPGDEDWGFDNVIEVRASIDVGPLHHASRSWPAGAGPAPPEPTWTIYLPGALHSIAP